MVRVVVALFFAMPFLYAGAQNRPPRIEASLSADTVMIGDQFMLNVVVEKDVMQVVDLPVFQELVLGGLKQIEVLSEKTDTAQLEGRQVKVSKQYLLTCFDEGEYDLGTFPALYMDKNVTDTLWTEQELKLVVITYAIDTTTQTIYDITLPRKAPFKLGEISLMHLLAGQIALFVVLMTVFLIMHRKYRRVYGPRIVESPHGRAIRVLIEISHQKLWQNNKHKEYYTKITDALRQYLEERYGIYAMEMTSDEIMEALAEVGLTRKTYDDLEEVLRVADLVKFAKQIPDSELNEKVYLNAYYFVEETKITPIENGEENEVEINQEKA